MKIPAQLPPKVKNIEELKELLQLALFIELSTIPPYLVAMYSLKENSNRIPFELIRSIVIEEMLHMILVSNILNSIGGKPRLDHSNYIPNYPVELPIKDGDSNLIINLQKFSNEAIKTFLVIERPTPFKQIRKNIPIDESFNSIAEFYDTIKDSLIYLHKHEKALFNGDIDKQIGSEYYYNSGGAPVIVTNLETALEAIEIIIEQGHGDDLEIPMDDNLPASHYERFQHILEPNKVNKLNPMIGDDISVEWNKVYNMIKNPKNSYYMNDVHLLNKSKEFNITYTKMINQLHNV